MRHVWAWQLALQLELGPGLGPGLGWAGCLSTERPGYSQGIRAVLEAPEVQDQVGSVVPAHHKSWGLERDKAALEFYSLQNFSKEKFKCQLLSRETTRREFLTAWSQYI